MQQRTSVITIAADNLPVMRDFYENVLEWKPVARNQDIVFYQHNGFLFSIGKRTLLADFVGDVEGSGFRSFTVGYNVGTEEEVRAIFEELKNKGVKILKEPTAPPFGGLFFYYADVEGNVLEVACNPFVMLDENGNAVDHQPIDDL